MLLWFTLMNYFIYKNSLIILAIILTIATIHFFSHLIMQAKLCNRY